MSAICHWRARALPAAAAARVVRAVAAHAAGAPASSELLVKREAVVGGEVAVLTMDRPKAKNAIGRQLLESLRSELLAVAAAPVAKRPRAVVLRSAVAATFCAGADLRERRTMTPDEARKFVDTLRDTFTLLADLPVPTVATVDGYALGGGFEMALACDAVVAGSGAVFGLPETGLGIIPGAGGTQRLARRVGVMRAKEMVLTGRRFGAQEALDAGVATEAAIGGTGSECADAAAMALAERIARHSAPLAAAAAKRAIDGGAELEISEGFELERECYETLLGTEDRLEALAAFAEKRRPEFQGK